MAGPRGPVEQLGVRLQETDEERAAEELKSCQPARRCASAKCVAVLGFLVVLLALGAAIFCYGPTRLLRRVLHLLPRKPGWGWYIGMGMITTVSIVTLMPIWPPLCMASGLVFGLLYGTLLNFASIVSAAVTSLVLGRWLLRQPIRQWLEAGDYPQVQRVLLVLEDSENSLKFQVLFRFLFIPMFVRNYGPSTLQIPMWKLCLGTLPHSLWISFLFASLGATFKNTAELIRDGKEVDHKALKWQQVAVLLVSTIVAILLACYAHCKYKEHLSREEAGALASQEHNSMPPAFRPAPDLDSPGLRRTDMV